MFDIKFFQHFNFLILLSKMNEEFLVWLDIIQSFLWNVTIINSFISNIE